MGIVELPGSYYRLLKMFVSDTKDHSSALQTSDADDSWHSWASNIINILPDSAGLPSKASLSGGSPLIQDKEAVPTPHASKGGKHVRWLPGYTSSVAVSTTTTYYSAQSRTSAQERPVVSNQLPE
jgi:hypothetical protein